MLVGEGVLTKMCRKRPKARQFFLFNDILVYGNIVIGKKKYNKQHIIPLEEVQLQGLEDNGRTCLFVYDSGGVGCRIQISKLFTKKNLKDKKKNCFFFFQSIEMVGSFVQLLSRLQYMQQQAQKSKSGWHTSINA